MKPIELKPRERIELAEWHSRARGQGVTRHEDIAFICPRCGTVQSGQSLIDAGAGSNFDDVDRYLGFSCVGRFKNGIGCDWTLGGLFQIHELEVTAKDGSVHPHFRFATPEEAQALIAARPRHVDL